MASLGNSSRRSSSYQYRQSRKAGSAKSRKKVSGRSKRKKNIISRSIPPVMVRSSVAGIAPPVPRRKSRPKHRYDVALNVPGAEMRLPSLPTVGTAWRWMSFMIAGMIAFLIYQAMTSPTFRVSAAEVQGLQRVSAGTVNMVLGITGKPIYMLDKYNLEEAVKNVFPEFSAVSVEIDLPNSVLLLVEERTPVLTWIENGNAHLVDVDGYRFPYRENQAGMPEPIVEAFGAPPVPQTITIESIWEDPEPEENIDEETSTIQAAPFIKPEMVTAIRKLAKHAPGNTHLVYDTTHNLGWKDPRGWEVYFGDAQEITTKLRVYEAIVEQLTAEGIRPAIISVTHVHAPYYRMER